MAQPPIDAPIHLSARTIFDSQVVPLLLPTCGVCHKLVGGVGPAFLATGSPSNYDPYPVTSTWPGFIGTTPELSALLTKGQHEGPTLTLDQYAAALSWLTQEFAERSASTVNPFNPAVTPFVPLIGKLNTVQLTPINSQFSGAYMTFNTTLISPTLGLELTGIKFYNYRAGSVTGDQRSIHIQRPLFIVWKGTTAQPDPVDSFSTTDVTIPLEIPAGSNPPVGQTIVPGLLTLPNYVPGNALSISFNLMQLVPPSKGSNPCKTAGYTVFTGQVVKYLAATGSCTSGATACHSASGSAGGVDMSPTLNMNSPQLPALCEILKFYNSVGSLKNNTDPTATYNHPYKWWTTTSGKPDNCTANGFPVTCFADFSTALANWKAAEQ